MSLNCGIPLASAVIVWRLPAYQSCSLLCNILILLLQLWPRYNCGLEWLPTAVFITPVCVESLLSDLVTPQSSLWESVQFVPALGDDNVHLLRYHLTQSSAEGDPEKHTVLCGSESCCGLWAPFSGKELLLFPPYLKDCPMFLSSNLQIYLLKWQVISNKTQTKNSSESCNNSSGQ